MSFLCKAENVFIILMGEVQIHVKEWKENSSTKRTKTKKK